VSKPGDTSNLVITLRKGESAVVHLDDERQIRVTCVRQQQSRAVVAVAAPREIKVTREGDKA